MLSDQEKKEMLEDAFSQNRKNDFLEAKKKIPKSSRSLDDYINFLMAVQKIRPFKYSRTINFVEKNIL